MTTVIGAIMLGLEPVVFLVGGIYAGTAYGGIVCALRGAREERVELAFVRSRVR
jgi:formate-dependent nitrite reductase membrane component NrfD